MGLAGGGLIFIHAFANESPGGRIFTTAFASESQGWPTSTLASPRSPEGASVSLEIWPSARRAPVPGTTPQDVTQH